MSLGLWIAVSVAIGAAIGAAVHQTAMGVAFGAAFGTALGTLARRAGPFVRVLYGVVAVAGVVACWMLVTRS